MTAPKIKGNDTVIIKRNDLRKLIDALIARGYEVVGPTVQDATIMYDTLTSLDDLPIGLTDEQDGGTYSLKQRKDKALFGYVLGPHSWKKFLYPPEHRLWKAEKKKEGFKIITQEEADEIKYAFFGVRPCEISAIEIQDNVLTKSEYADASYTARRKNALIIAVNCTQPGGTCFCFSMKTGPKATKGFDIAMTEVIKGASHYFVAEAGSSIGTELLEEIPCKKATKEEIETAETLVKRAERNMGRSLDTRNIKELFYNNDEHERWDEVASRCLTCGNCTMVCPTCFCVTVEDKSDVKGETAERWRRWDSCFTTGFSYIYGGSVRTSARARYRHWITHKLASWIDQFGTSGCVGCGRCITWCPVGIDITEEAAALRSGKPSGAPKKSKKEVSP